MPDEIGVGERLTSVTAALAATPAVKQLAGDYEAQSKLDTYAPNVNEDIARRERSIARSLDCLSEDPSYDLT